MNLTKKIKKLLKINNENENEKAIKHTIYYLYSENLKDENLQGLFENYKTFYNDKHSYLNQYLKDLGEKAINVKELDPGYLYENITTNKLKKTLGQVYTPQDTINSMIKLINFKDFKDINKIKIIDISCGSGYFLLEIIKTLENQGLKAKDIIRNNIYGIDKDEFSVFLTKLSILIKYENLKEKDINIYQQDILLHDLLHVDIIKNIEFDVVIGNPPYIGHKNLDNEYKRLLYNRFSTFKNKSDISFCFFEKGWEILKKDGALIFITSRYFLEGHNSYEIRRFIKENFKIDSIIDYQGHTLFKNINISPLIIKLTKTKESGIFNYKYKTDNKFKELNFPQDKLQNTRWIIKPEKELKLLEKLYKKSDNILEDLLDFKQGIITGFDRAFIVGKEEIQKHSLEDELLKKWLKNSNIQKDKLNILNNKKIIYLKDEDINKYPNTHKYLSEFKPRLEKRRECKSGVIKWYQIQWPRERNLFEDNKIIFPYKKSEPTFFLDTNSYYCSADIYLAIKKYKELNYRSLVDYLNSSIFKFICYMELKKVGKNQFEFYPYALKKLPLPNKDFFINNHDYGYVSYKELLYENFKLNKTEIKIIENL